MKNSQKIILILLVLIVCFVVVFYEVDYYPSKKIIVRNSDGTLIDSAEVSFIVTCRSMLNLNGSPQELRYQMISTRGVNGVYEFPSKLIFKLPLDLDCKSRLDAKELGQKLWIGKDPSFLSGSKYQREVNITLQEFNPEIDRGWVEFEPTDFSKFNKVIR